MPTYDYRCKECGNTFEEFQSMSAEMLVNCPACGKPALVRLFAQGAGMIFKGSGFYLTDYKKSGSASSSPTTQDSKPKDSTSKDSKPEGSPKPETPKADS